MNSIGENCTELKKEYDACFNAWFSEHFLKGNTDEAMCAPIFKVYQECVKRALKEQSIELDIEGDLDAEFRPPPSSSRQQHGKHGS